MSSLSAERVDRLLWLGRYIERCYTTLTFIVATYDKALDSVEGNWKGQLEELGFDEETDDPMDFFNDCLFDAESAISIKHSLSCAYDNAIVLRDVLGTETLAYVQMAVNSLEKAETSTAPLLELASLVDDIMAFKGCCDDYIADDVPRNILKCGFSIERMDLYTRLNYRLDELPKEARKMASRIDRIGIAYDRAAFKDLICRIYDPAFPEGVTYDDLGQMLVLLARLF